MVKRRDLWILTLQFLVLLVSAPAAVAIEPTPVKITPATVEMGTFYGGAKMHVAGTAGAGSKVIIVVRGPTAAEFFNKIGRVGPIWVNTGKVTISGVPSLLLIFSSEPVNACLNSAAVDQYQLDLGSLKKYMEIETKVPDRDRIARDFLAFKARQGNYRINSASLQIGAPAQSELPYRLDFEMPRTAAPGKYQVSVLECHDGRVANKSDVELAVVEVGFPALVARLASDYASFYGIISVIIAMVAGFGIDFIASRIFRRKVSGR